MSQSKVDLVLHPIRMRIITELMRQDMSPQQLAKQMPDIAQATLYRHINALADGNILEVVSETPIRGTVEKVYRVITGAGRLSQDEIQAMSSEEHVRYFTTFAASLIGDFIRFVENASQNNTGVIGGNVGYRKMIFHLSEEEATELRKTITDAFQKAYRNPPSPERRPYIVSLISIPDKSSED